MLFKYTASEDVFI